MGGDLVQRREIHLAGRALAEEQVVLGQPALPLVPGAELDMRVVALRHLVTHLDVLGRQDHDGGAREVFVDVAVAAVVQQTDGGVETVTNRPGLVDKIRVGRFAAE